MFRFFSCSLILLLFNLPGLPARSLTDLSTNLTVTDAENNTWHDFARFLDAGKGSHVSGMSELKKYFNRFGYLNISENNCTDVFDENLELAVKNYQKNLGLPITSKLDSDTINQIMAPRCGVGDKDKSQNQNKFHVVKRFAYFYGQPRWSRSSPVVLTYAFSPTDMIDYIDLGEISLVFQRAFSRWSSVIPVNFTEAEDYQTADIKIGFFQWDHGDGEPFDGVLKVLAHAFSPDNGRLHLDGSETWAVDFKTQKSNVAVDLESVATHEIGHVLGLAHSSVKEAIMYPSLKPRTKKVDLTRDDVDGIQALYGSNPNFNPNSLLESAISSSWAIVVDRRTFSSLVILGFMLSFCLL